MSHQKNGFKHKHSLGQNFIIDEFLLEDIADESGITKDDFVLEIGPGNGALTRCLCDRARYVVSVEIDKSLIPLLKSNLKDYRNVSIINADFMELDFQAIVSEFGCEPNTCRGEACEPSYGQAPEQSTSEQSEGSATKHSWGVLRAPIKVVANLPYYITSPIINNLLQNPYISEMTLMVQKEVAERIVATPNSKDFGVLTLACNYFAKTEMIMLVSKNCFYPVPKVDSAVVHFSKHPEFIDISNENNFSIEDNPEYKKLFNIIKAAFSQRRKKLSNSLSNTLNLDKNLVSDLFSKLGFDENVRAENLSLSDYKNLSLLI